MDTALCPTNTMDGLALAKALQDVTGNKVSPELLVNSVDFRNIFYKFEERVASQLEIVEFRTRYSFHLRRQYLIRPSVIPANYSLIERANSLQNRKDTVVGIVTSTSLSALQLKSRNIGLYSELMPVATSEDSDSLEGILSAIKTRARRSFGFQFEKASLVSGEHWIAAAKQSNMLIITPENIDVNNAKYFDYIHKASNTTLA
ncbi:hypothetical protein [Reinekea sp.]|uniref:hypothetical protein n=1 Tax=Reinekea sp. TaxID=1970455 RepID=UPI003988DB86